MMVKVEGVLERSGLPADPFAFLGGEPVLGRGPTGQYCSQLPPEAIATARTSPVLAADLARPVSVISRRCQTPT
jgi:hypothetical protein